jgi:thymidine phosphorylase
VRTPHEAEKLQAYFIAVGQAIGITVKTIISDGSQPVGRGIGPALEAVDVLAVLRNAPDAPQDLKAHALVLAGNLLEMSGEYADGAGMDAAAVLLESGRAYKKFIAICEAQGGFRDPVVSPFRFDVLSEADGTVSAVDNRAMAKVAKLAGAPKSQGSGVLFLSPLGKKIVTGDVLFSIFAASQGELDYAVAYLKDVPHIIMLA